MSEETKTLQNLLSIAQQAAAAGATVLAGRDQADPSGLPLSSQDHGIETKSSVSTSSPTSTDVLRKRCVR